MKDMGTSDPADDRIASYSSKGPTLLDQVVKPDLVAPGNRIVAALSSSSSLPYTYPDAGCAGLVLQVGEHPQHLYARTCD